MDGFFCVLTRLEEYARPFAKSASETADGRMSRNFLPVPQAKGKSEAYYLTPRRQQGPRWDRFSAVAQAGI